MVCRNNRQYLCHNDMICHNRHYVRCYNSTTYNASYHGMLQQQKLAMSQHMMSHAMTHHALCHVLWHNSIQCHSIIFWNKMQYVVACYASVNSMSQHSMSYQQASYKKSMQQQSVCHYNICSNDKQYVITT